jgi:hypothetical protein
LFVIIAWIRFFLVSLANPSVAFLGRMAWFDLSKVFQLIVIFLLLVIRRLDLVFLGFISFFTVEFFGVGCYSFVVISFSYIFSCTFQYSFLTILFFKAFWLSEEKL